METTITDERAFSSAEIVPDENVLEPKYHMVSKIGEGGYGAVFEVVDPDSGRFALKVQKVRRDVAQLEKEFEMYDILSRKPKSGHQTPRIPLVYAYTEYEGLEYMIMEMLGDTLNEIAGRFQGRQLSKLNVLMIGIQAVRTLQYIHENGILHRDIKPHNMAMGSGKDNESTLHIIDFGLATKVDDWSTYDCHKEVGFAGTQYYAAVEALLNKAPTRKGDLESLSYTLLDLTYGGLPWQFNNPKTGRRFEGYEIGLQRLQLTPSICQGFPEFKGFFDAVSKTERTEKPDYDDLINLLQTAINEFEGGNDVNFEWLEAKNDVNYSSTIHSGDQHHAAQSHQENAKSSAKCETEDIPLAPPGFESKICNRKRDTAVRDELPAKNINPLNCDADKSSTLARGLTPETQSRKSPGKILSSIEQIPQSAEEDNVSELQSKEAGKEENEAKIGEVRECKRATHVILERKEARKGCDDSAPRPPKAGSARSERKRTFVKRMVCNGISRAVRAITGAAASKFVRIGGLRS